LYSQLAPVLLIAPAKQGRIHQTDQSWARHPRHEPLVTLQLGADNPAF